MSITYAAAAQPQPREPSDPSGGAWTGLSPAGEDDASAAGSARYDSPPPRIDTPSQALQLARHIVRNSVSPAQGPVSPEAARFLAHQMLADHVIEAQRAELGRLQEEVRRIGSAERSRPAESPRAALQEGSCPRRVVPAPDVAVPPYDELMAAPDSGIYSTPSVPVPAAARAGPQPPAARRLSSGPRTPPCPSAGGSRRPSGQAAPAGDEQLLRVMEENARLREQLEELRRRIEDQGGEQASAAMESVTTAPPPYAGGHNPVSSASADVDWEDACGQVLDVVKEAQQRQQEADDRVAQLQCKLEQVEALRWPLQPAEAEVFLSPVASVATQRQGEEAPPAAAPATFSDTAAALLPPGWKEYFTEAGRAYYHHAGSRRTQWRRPSEPPPAAPPPVDGAGGAAAAPPATAAGGSRRPSGQPFPVTDAPIVSGSVSPSRPGSRKPSLSVDASAQPPPAEAAPVADGGARRPSLLPGADETARETAGAADPPPRSSSPGPVSQPSLSQQRAAESPSPAPDPMEGTPAVACWTVGTPADQPPLPPPEQPPPEEIQMELGAGPAEVERVGLALLRSSSPRARLRGLSLLRCADPTNATLAAETASAAAAIAEVDELRRRLAAAEAAEEALRAGQPQLEGERGTLEAQLAALQREADERREQAQELLQRLAQREEEVRELRQAASVAAEAEVHSEPPPPPPVSSPPFDQQPFRVCTFSGRDDRAASPLICPPVNSVTTVTVEPAPAEGVPPETSSSPVRVTATSMPLPPGVAAMHRRDIVTRVSPQRGHAPYRDPGLHAQGVVYAG